MKTTSSQTELGRVRASLFSLPTILWPWLSMGILKTVQGPQTLSLSINGASTDTRAIQPGDLFFALKGERFDGHDFVAVALNQGAAAVVVDHVVESVVGLQIVVSDVKRAYQLFAASWGLDRTQERLMVAGSNGKTTTTQMLIQVLREAYGERVYGTQGNNNNDIGVAKTLLETPAEADTVVVEAGISHPDDMLVLAQTVLPTAVLITNAQREHQEFLASPHASALENGKSMLPFYTRCAVLPLDDPEYDTWKAQADRLGVRVLTYALRDEQSHSANEQKADYEGIYTEEGLRAMAEGEAFDIPLSISGRHNAHNALGVYAMAKGYLGAPRDKIQAALSAFKPLSGRGQVYKTPDQRLVVIDEVYNANPDSVRAAMRVLAARAETPKTLVLGDMGEVGQHSREYHAEIGEYAKALELDHLIVIGPESREAARHFGPKAVIVDSQEEAMKYLSTMTGVVTIKASHYMRLDRLVKALVTP